MQLTRNGDDGIHAQLLYPERHRTVASLGKVAGKIQGIFGGSELSEMRARARKAVEDDKGGDTMEPIYTESMSRPTSTPTIDSDTLEYIVQSQVQLEKNLAAIRASFVKTRRPGTLKMKAKEIRTRRQRRASALSRRQTHRAPTRGLSNLCVKVSIEVSVTPTCVPRILLP